VEQGGIGKPFRKVEQVAWTECVQPDGEVEPFMKMERGSKVNDEVHFRPERLEGMRVQTEIGTREVSGHDLDFVANEALKPLTVPGAETLKDRAAKDGSLRAKADGYSRILSGVRTHQENNPADLGQLPQNSLDEHLPQEACAPYHEQGLIMEKVSDFAHAITP
jgi:hypothetical protein